MTLWRAVRLVARREFSERVRQRAWQISTAVTVVLLVGAGVAAGLIGGDDSETFEIGAQGPEAVAVAEVARSAAPQFDSEVDVTRFDSSSAARAAVRDESVDVALTGATIVSLDELSGDLERLLQLASRQVQGAEQLRGAGLSEAEARRALNPPPLRAERLEGDDSGAAGLAFVASLLLYGQLIVYGLAVATGVVEEKASRVVEVLLATIEPRALLAGKIVGIGLLGLAQLAISGTLGVAAAVASGAIELDSSSLGTLAVALVWFLFGYAFYSTLYAISGVMVSRQEDLQSSSTPLTMVLVLSYLVALPAVYEPSSTIAQVSALVPFSSPIVMPALVAQGEASAVEMALSLGLLALSVALLVPLGARIYDRTILRMGRPARLAELWRSARA